MAALFPWLGRRILGVLFRQQPKKHAANRGVLGFCEPSFEKGDVFSMYEVFHVASSGRELSTLPFISRRLP